MAELDLTDRSTLMRSLPHGGHVVEVGVQIGAFAEVILNENCPKTLTLIDCWCRQPGTKFAVVDPATESQDHNSNWQHVVNMFTTDKRVRVVKGFSIEESQRYCDKTLDIVYIDADHTRLSDDIAAWWPKIVHGGWLTGHDYYDASHSSVKQTIDTFVRTHGLTLRTTRDNYPSWAINKP